MPVDSYSSNDNSFIITSLSGNEEVIEQTLNRWGNTEGSRRSRLKRIFSSITGQWCTDVRVLKNSTSDDIPYAHKFKQENTEPSYTLLSLERLERKRDLLTGYASEPSPTTAEALFIESPAEPLSAPVRNNSNGVGTLKADNFTLTSNEQRVVFQGNGNVDWGTGGRDVIDLSQFSREQATFNLATLSGGGVPYDFGNGSRILDAITLNNGQEILFEGIDSILFADGVVENLSVIPEDPLFSQQWNLHVMGVHNAWRFTPGSEQVLIGIQDTGSGTDENGQTHPDLRPAKFVSDSNRGDEWSSFSHGTLGQGTISAISNNGIGISGINWSSETMVVDVVGGEAGDYNLVSATQAMLNEAMSTGRRLVINLGLSGGSSPDFERLIAENQNEALFVVAAGNQDLEHPNSPADLANVYGNVIAVGASWGNYDWYGNPKTPGERISYEGWWGSNKGVTLTAPSEFPSTSATRDDENSSVFEFDYNRYFNGTSAAAPNVAGVASLVWGVNPSLSAIQVRSILSETAYDLGDPGFDGVFGYGLVNADAAVRRAIALTPQDPVV